jgi:hypothetical protein
MRRLGPLGATTVLLCAVGCTHSSPATPPPATVPATSAHDTASIVGTFEVVGGPAPGLNRPLSGSIEIHLGSESGRIVDTVPATDGHFHALVAPGHYVLVGRSVHLPDAACSTAVTAIVSHAAHVQVRCQIN